MCARRRESGVFGVLFERQNYCSAVRARRKIDKILLKEYVGETSVMMIMTMIMMIM